MKKTAIFGAGYVGLVSGTSFSDIGHYVTVADVLEERINDLNQGVSPIEEPGLSELIKKNILEERISFTLDAKKAIQESEYIFIAVGTPENEDGTANLNYVFDVANSIAEHINDYKVVIVKSTALPGTCEKVYSLIKEKNPDADFDIVSNPETLKQGNAIKDFMEPDRIILGVNNERAKQKMKEFYNYFEKKGYPLVFTKIPSSELAKYGSNGFLGTKISYANLLAPCCEATGADINEVSMLMGLDNRIGPKFLNAGAGWGGSCFPKDIRALARFLESLGLRADILNAVDDINEYTKQRVYEKVNQLVPDLENKTIGLLGLAFKPNTDDIREAPSIRLIENLLLEGARIQAYDPWAMENMKKLFPQIDYLDNPYSVAEDSDALVLITEWDEFKNLDMSKIVDLMYDPNFLDARNVYDPEIMKSLGFNYLSMGRQ